MKLNQYIVEVQFLSRNILLGTEEYEVEARTGGEANDLVLGRAVGSHYASDPNVTYRLKFLRVNHG
jgi:hypothetical protein